MGVRYPASESGGIFEASPKRRRSQMRVESTPALDGVAKEHGTEWAGKKRRERAAAQRPRIDRRDQDQTAHAQHRVALCSTILCRTARNILIAVAQARPPSWRRLRHGMCRADRIQRGRVSPRIEERARRPRAQCSRGRWGADEPTGRHRDCRWHKPWRGAQEQAW